MVYSRPDGWPLAQPPRLRKIDWLAILEEHDVQFVVLHRRDDRRLVSCLKAHPDWTVNHQETDTLFFARRPQS